MKKHLLVFALLLAGFGAMSQDTITGWTFPVNSGIDSLNANLGLTANHSYDIRFEGTDTVYNTIYFGVGPTSFAAASHGWDAGADAKFWSVKFKANNYRDFRLFSKQKGDATDPGPRDWKVQWKLSGGTWADIPNGIVTATSDWAGGVINNLPVPVTGQGTSSIYIRWIMTSNNDINGNVLLPSGVAMIDDIVITATNSTGNEEILLTNRIKVSPNPNHGQFRIESTVNMAAIRILDLGGREVFSSGNPGQAVSVGLNNAAKGQYILSVKFADQDNWYNKKFIIE